MKSRPIIFGSQMVRALLDGRKSQTRRLIKNKDTGTLWDYPPHLKSKVDYCPYGKVGDRLWVREKIYCFDGHILPKQKPLDFDGDLTRWGCDYAEQTDDGDSQDSITKVVSPIFMPRWCSRIELVLTNISIERVGDISEADAIAEGLKVEKIGTVKRYEYTEDSGKYYDPITAFYALWNSVNNKTGTRIIDDPWVWVLKFSLSSTGTAGVPHSTCTQVSGG